MKKKKISANEINKFCYCNYQWYYEKIYGAKEIKRLNYEYCKENGIKSNGIANKNFARGRKFHNNYLFYYKLKKLFKFCCFLLILCVVLFIIGYFLNYYSVLDLGVLYDFFYFN